MLERVSVDYCTIAAFNVSSRLHGRERKRPKAARNFKYVPIIGASWQRKEGEQEIPEGIRGRAPGVGADVAIGSSQAQRTGRMRGEIPASCRNTLELEAVDVRFVDLEAKGQGYCLVGNHDHTLFSRNRLAVCRVFAIQGIDDKFGSQVS